MKSRFLCPKLSKANGNHVQYFNVCSLHSYYLCALIICIALNVAVCRLAAKLITILYSGLSAKQSFVDVVNYMLIWREREREKTIYISGKMLAYSSQCTWIDFVSISETHTSCICNGLHGRNEPAQNFPTQLTRNMYIHVAIESQLNVFIARSQPHAWNKFIMFGYIWHHSNWIRLSLVKCEP